MTRAFHRIWNRNRISWLTYGFLLGFLIIFSQQQAVVASFLKCANTLFRGFLAFQPHKIKTESTTNSAPNLPCKRAKISLDGTPANPWGKEDGDYTAPLRDEAFRKRTKSWVVIVDDEESIRLAVGDYLYEQGYQVSACADADALVELCVAVPIAEQQLPRVPDCIISDIRMPGKDGLQLLNWIRNHQKESERLSRVPVVLLTAKSLTQDRIDGYKAGADAYLPKPFNPEELLAIVDNVILRRQQMTGDTGKLADVKAEVTDIKQILKQNERKVVKATNVYLTPMEQEVLELLSMGYSNGEIAEKRGVNIVGVNKTVQTLYLKTQTKSRTEMLRWGIQTGYVSPR